MCERGVQKQPLVGVVTFVGVAARREGSEREGLNDRGVALVGLLRAVRVLVILLANKVVIVAGQASPAGGAPAETHTVMKRA